MFHVCVQRFDGMGENFLDGELNRAAAKGTHKILSQSPRQLITYYLWYFADVTAYLLNKDIEKIRLQVLFRL